MGCAAPDCAGCCLTLLLYITSHRLCCLPSPPLPLQALKNEPLTLFGDGKQTRSFQYVSDLIEGGCLPACMPADPLLAC